MILNNFQKLPNLHNLGQCRFYINVDIYLPLFKLPQKIINDCINVTGTLILNKICPKDLILICIHQYDLDDISTLLLLHLLFHQGLHLIINHLSFNL